MWIMHRYSIANRQSNSGPASRRIFFLIVPVILLSLGTIAVVGLHTFLRRRASRRRSNALSIRTQQARVIDIAKALLDTIPVVKFREQQTSNLAASGADVESARANDIPLESRGANEPLVQPLQPKTRNTEEPRGSIASENDSTQYNRTHLPFHDCLGNIICPICTENFVDGQDLRVLPCLHRFHPTCIDPWLLKRSSTCPMCRSDISPLTLSSR